MRAILTYHSIDASGSPISVHPDAFGRQLAWLTSGRVTVTSIPALLAMPATADAVAVTFDDAFANVHDALSDMTGRGLPVTTFVVTDRVGTTNAWNGRPVPGIPDLPLLDWPSLRALRERGVTIGAHSRTHADLTRLPPAAAEEEVRGSADTIEREVGVRPDTFAYPYGTVNGTAAALVARHFRYACTTEFRPLSDDAPLPLLPRLDMYYLQAPGRIEGWGTPAFTRFLNLRHGLRRVRQALGQRRWAAATAAGTIGNGSEP